MYEHTAIGYRIVDAREYLGLSRKDIAHYLGYSVDTLTEWETGYKEPDDDAITALTRLLKVSPTYFLEGPSEEDKAIEAEIMNGITLDLSVEDKRHVARFAQFLRYAGYAPKVERTT